jgi:hypothetical protein
MFSTFTRKVTRQAVATRAKRGFFFSLTKPAGPLYGERGNNNPHMRVGVQKVSQMGDLIEFIYNHKSSRLLFHRSIYVVLSLVGVVVSLPSKYFEIFSTEHRIVPRYQERVAARYSTAPEFVRPASDV